MKQLSILLSVVLWSGCAIERWEQPEPASPPVTDPVVPEDEPEEETPFVYEIPDVSTSGRFVFRKDGKGMLVADPDTDGLLIHRRAPGTATRFPLPGEPSRLLRVGERVFVTLRASGELVELSVPEDADPTETRRVAVGSEPFDVVISEDLSTLYVSLSMEDAVVALDAESLEEIARYPVAFEPRWMTADTSPDGQPRLFVASARDPRITEIHAGDATTKIHLLPRQSRFEDPSCGDQTLAMRITANIEVSDDGTALWVPTLYADPALVVLDVDSTDDTGFRGDDPCDTVIVSELPNTGIWAIPVLSVEAARPGQFNPTLVKLELDGASPSEVIALGTPSFYEGVADNDHIAAMRSYPTGLTMVQTGGRDRVAWVAMEASDTIIALDLDRPTEENSGHFQTYERIGFDVPDGPSEVRISPDGRPEVWLWSWLDRAMTSYNPTAVNSAVRDGLLRTFEAEQYNPSPEPTTLTEAAQHGRRMFYSANDRAVVARSAGVSCSTCHPDTRSDGLTWFSDGLARQAPSLHGAVSATVPLGWEGEVQSIEDEVITTTTTRTGGTGLTRDEAADVAAFIDSTRDIIPPPIVDDAEREAVVLGREVFSREEVGCSTCHSGDQGTDGENHEVFGVLVNTPRLKGLAGSAPYYRDGSAPTIRDALERSRDGSMGDTSMLTEEEMLALEAFLRRF